MPLDGKTPRESRAVMTEIVLPSDANPLGTIFGGRVMQWLDICAAIAASRHCRRQVVTASMDDLHFHAPIHVGEFAVLEGTVHAAFRTSMEVGVTVHAENPTTGARRLCTSAFLTFVALGGDGRPTEVPPVIPETDEERRLLEASRARRAARLSRKRAS
jgi:acyl-CoA hydrolase